MKKFLLSITCFFFFLGGIAEAACSAGTACENYQGTIADTSTGGMTNRTPENRKADNWVEAPEIGVDCTDVADSTTAIQTWANVNPSGHLNFPLGCDFHTSSTVTVNSGTGITISSSTFVGDGVGSPAKWTWKGTNGGSGCTTSFSSCVYVLDFEHSDHPVVQNMSFVSPGDKNCPDGFLKFDGNPGGSQIGTNGRIIGSSFSNGRCNNGNFVAVNISQTATNNHENYVVADNYVSCGDSRASIYAHDGVTNGTTTITSVTAPFTAADVGKRIRISYAGGMLDTTIASFMNSSTVILAAAPSWTQNNVTVVVGTSYGIGYRNGASQNAIQQEFIHLQYSRCAVGILVRGGNVQITQPSGGASDIGIEIGGFVAQNVSIDYYASESDFQAIVLQSGAVAPISITNSRFSNGNQMANGHVLLSNAVTFINNLFDFDTQANAVLIGLYPGGSGPIISMNNDLRGYTWAHAGYSAFTNPPVVSLRDRLSAAQDDVPGQQTFGCYGGTAPCFYVSSRWGNVDGTTFKANAGNQTATLDHKLVGIQGTGDAYNFKDFTAVQGLGNARRFTHAQVALEAAWPALDLSGNPAPSAVYGVHVNGPPSTSGGTLPNIYGLYIEKQKVGNIRAGWGIYQVDSGDQNFFGGPILMQKNTPTLSAPGAGNLRTEVVCGTNAGTARLQAYAGTSPTPVTILDNIGSGVSGC
jgi:hypothetical protein